MTWAHPLRSRGPVQEPWYTSYLALVRDRHTTALTQRVNYAAMAGQSETPGPARAVAAAGGVLPAQTDLIELLTATGDHDTEPQEHQ